MTLAPDDLGPTICIGEILVEIVATTEGDGFTETQPFLGPYPSGAPAIFIDQCGRIGGQAAMIGSVGQDDFGVVNTRRLTRDGVDTRAVAIHPGLPTGTAFVRYRPDGDRDFVFNMWTSAAGQLRWTDAVDTVVRRAGHLHVMGTSLVRSEIWDLVARAADLIKARGGSVSLDPNLRKELHGDGETGARFAQILSQSDLILPSGAELEAAAGTDDRTAAIDHLFSLGVGEVVCKAGADGATVYTPEATFTAPAFDVAELDPTGAGDCFGGAYVTCRRLGMGIDEALTYATAAGARNVTFLGPMEGAATRDELDSFIAATKRRA
ncbi:MAG: sugar kinase [Pseudomonadota bacterium]